MDDPRTKIITSATSYCAVSGTDDTSARPNTAALAIYVLAKNPGMHISDNLGVVHDLSHVETDPGQIIIIPGKQLSLATKNMFGATMHPIFPKEEGEERFTWRIFTYFNEETLDMLESKQQETSIHHATQIN
jgi:isopenicillin N synthase-like dioxygenase